MLPKNIYMSLSSKDKAKIKSKLLKGSGAYLFDKKKNPYGHYGEKIGKYLSPFLGNYAPIARSIGAYGGHAIGKLFGSGDYINTKGKYIPSYKGAHKMFKGIKGSGSYGTEYNKDVITNSTSPPSFGSNRTIINHREFIGNIQGSTSFTINTFNVNPGDDATFPWLSNLAANYEKYRPISIVFEYKSTSATALNSTNTALGTVMLAPRYNAVNSSIPQSKMEMLQIENCTSCSPAESAMNGIECAKNYNPLGILYIRNGTIPITGSEQFYDFADFYIATEGMQAVATIGELWVTYQIELLTPILGGGQVGDDINFANYSLSSSVTTSAYFAGADSSSNVSNLELTFGGTTITFPDDITTGTYLLIYTVTGTSTAVTQPTVAFTTNCAAMPIWIGNTVSAFGTTATVTTLQKIVVFEITGPSAVLTFSGATLPANISSGNVNICQLPQH